MGGLTGLPAVKIGQLSAAQIRSLTASDIAELTAAQLAGLAASQLALFSASQLAGLSKTQIGSLSIAAMSGFTPAQMAFLTTAQVSGLTAAQISALSLAQFGGLSAADIAALSTTQVAALTTSQVAAIKTTQFAGLSAADLAALSITQIRALTAAQLAVLSVAQLSGLSAADIAALFPAQIASLSATDIASLSAVQVKALTSAQVTALTIAQLGAVSAAQIGLLTAAALTGLTAAQIAALTTKQLAGLTADQLSTLSPAQIAALTTAQLAGLTATQFGALTGTQIGALTTADIRSFSATRVGSLTPAQIAGLSASQIGALSPAQLASLTINYNTMLAILQADAAGGMTAGEFSALHALAAKLNAPGGISVSAYVQQITNDVVLGNAANATWTGGGARATNLGNLTAASSQTQVSELIGKWFLGADLPSSLVAMSGVPSFSVSYSAVPNPLFGNGGPKMSDINQGYLGDCYVLAPLAGIAFLDPSAIRSMITANGNNTYSVRFSVNGKDNYVTVDNKLAGGGAIFNNATNDWASLIEKAYTQLQAGGAVTGDRFTYGNSYSSIGNGGYVESTMAEITGASSITDFVANGLNWSSYTYDGASLTVPNNPSGAMLQYSKNGLSETSVQAALVADLTAGYDLILSSYTDGTDKSGKTTLVADHAMAVYGFDTGTGMFQVYNPWGTFGDGGQYWDTTFEIGLDSLLANKDAISVAANPPPLIGSAAPLLAGLAQPPANSLGLAAV